MRSPRTSTREQPLLVATRESLCTATNDPAMPKINQLFILKSHKQPMDNVKLGEWGVQMDSLVIFLMWVQAK